MTNSEPEEQEYDWGSDGSDPHKTVRAHVEAALIPTSGEYPPPLDQLLALGSPLEQDDIQARIKQLGVTQEHVPDLVRMARDRALNTMDSESAAVWAPIHAIVALAGLDVSAHAAELVPLFDVDSEWFGEDLPDILGQVGMPALEPLRQYVQDNTRWQYGRWNAGTALEKLGQQHPELRDPVIHILSDALEHAAENTPDTNGFFLANLLHLQAVEALPVIRRVFEQDAIDESIAGDWGEVQKALGQKVDQHDPLYQRWHQRRSAKTAEMRAMFPPEFGVSDPLFEKAPLKGKSAVSKHKTKRKASSAARKANKKKKRK
ncbi:MAG TPA: hypothetical protein VFU22_17025 [Roseiflexaceae bacterium]|nr:hypothetical protein [Roseiflexaceae bacterium]